MGRLPDEIIANIILHLAAEGSSSHDSDDDNDDSDSSPAHALALALAPYATALTLDRVRRFVRSVRVDVLLPPYGGEQARARREDEADRARNDGVFTDVVRSVFGLLEAATATASESPAAMADLDVQGGIPGGDQGGGGDDGGHEADDGGQQQQQQQQDNDPLWPTMRHYTINPGAIAPSDSDSDDDGAASSVSEESSGSVAPGDEKENPFRDKLNPDAARALLLAAARAARRMPALRKMDLVLDPPVWRGIGRLEVEYTAAAMAGTARGGGAPSAPPVGGGGGGTAELLVESHPVFHPDEEVVQAWREAAEEYTGAELGLVAVVKEPMVW
ncbi:hypothetical protein C8A00DRAFT_28822 [Chaetomidium leptoderma]|uniref:F-box domain-containing protein n=1 Tax=Chaetomidium leptoderma TaxID=669021 RepID=A0AAN7A011_9PEZI|nr:hypothetical protein C8A00DRAFT_28822 [Chaetomidium leptoderma]